jgi:hypothetical protein
LKSLTIAGTSFAETRTLLDKAERAGIPLVVILTHPFEYIQSRDIGRQAARRHSVNQQRMVALCQYLDQNRDRFIATGLADAAMSSAGHSGPENPLLEGALWQSIRRMATQVSYDKFGQWALARNGVMTQ